MTLLGRPLNMHGPTVALLLFLAGVLALKAAPLIGVVTSGANDCTCAAGELKTLEPLR